jgi:hypothetical protein
MLTGTTLRRANIDAIALKPAEHDLGSVPELDAETVVVDYEGDEYVPDRETLAGLAEAYELFVTKPERADGFRPLGEECRHARLK